MKYLMERIYKMTEELLDVLYSKNFDIVDYLKFIDKNKLYNLSDKKDYEKIYVKYLDYVDSLFYQYYMSGWAKANQHSPTIMLDTSELIHFNYVNYSKLSNRLEKIKYFSSFIVPLHSASETISIFTDLKLTVFEYLMFVKKREINYLKKAKQSFSLNYQMNSKQKLCTTL